MTRRRPHPFAPDLLICLGLLAATAAVYWPVGRFGFVRFDDDRYVYANRHVAAGLTGATLRWAFTTFDVANYHPLTWVSFLLDRAVLGLRPGMMHAENVALHAADAVLLFGLFRRACGARWPAAFVAGVFAVHPAHVESVAWVSERKDVLSTLFLLVSAHAYVRFARGDRGRGLAYAGVVAAFVASLLSKPMGVTFPALLLLLDVWPLRRVGAGGAEPSPFPRVAPRTAVLEKLPLLALAVAASVATAAAQQTLRMVTPLRALSIPARLCLAVVAYARYVGESVWPHDLAAYYPLHGPPPIATVTGAALLVSAVTVASVWAGRRRPYVVVGWLWFLGTLVPVIGLVQVGSQSMADRYLYLPMVGLTVIVAWAGAEVSRRLGRGPVALVAGVVLVALAVAAREQVGFWANTPVLLARVLTKTGGNAAVYETVGAEAADAGDAAGGERAFARAERLDPWDYMAPFDLGNLRLRVEHCPATAIACYGRAAALRPDVAVVQANWGVALLQMGRPDQAYEHLRAAERLDPDAFDPHYNLGLLLLLSAGQRRSAAAEFAAALRVDPSSAAARGRLAEATGATHGGGWPGTVGP